MNILIIFLIIIIVSYLVILITKRSVKVHVLNENYRYVTDKLGLKVGDKIRLISDLKLYDIITKDGDIYIVQKNHDDTTDIYIIAILLIIIIGLVLVNSIRLNQVNNELKEDIIESNRVAIDSLNAEVSQYILRVAPDSELSGVILVNKCLEYDIDPAFVLAQAQLESHFGTKGLAKRTNSVWNVYAYDGLSYGELHHSGKYHSPDDSIDPYLKLITNKYLEDSSTDDLLVSFKNKDGNRYASDENYENRLRAIHDEIVSNTNISKLYKSIIKGVAK